MSFRGITANKLALTAAAELNPSSIGKPNFIMKKLFPLPKSQPLRLARVMCFALVFMSCKHRIHQGEIIEKEYEPARTYQYTTPVMVGEVTVLQWHTAFDDEDYIFKVRAIKGADTIVENFYVDKFTFLCMNRGELFNDSIPCSQDDDGLK